MSRTLIMAATVLVAGACSGATASEAVRPERGQGAAGPSATVAATQPDRRAQQRSDGANIAPQAASASAAPADPPLPSGPLTGDTIGVVVKRNFDGIRDCYTKGLQRDPKLAGWIDIHLSIAGDGTVLRASAKKDSDSADKTGRPRRWRPRKRNETAGGRKLLTDTEVVSCVEKAFMAIKFPPTGSGMLNLIYAQRLATE